MAEQTSAEYGVAEFIADVKGIVPAMVATLGRRGARRSGSCCAGWRATTRSWRGRARRRRDRGRTAWTSGAARSTRSRMARWR